MPRAKEVIQHDRFKVTAEVNEDLVGKLLSMLSRMGVEGVSYEMITDVHAYTKKTVHEVKAEDFLREWLQDHPTFAAREAITHFREDGRTDGSGYTALRILVEKRELKKLSPGNYQRADVKAIAAPKRKSPQQAAQRERHTVDHREFILRYARSHGGRFSRKKLIAYFEQHKRKASSVGGALNVLITNKLLKALGDGEYALLAKGAKSPTQSKTSNGNGADRAPDVTTAQEAAHG